MTTPDTSRLELAMAETLRQLDASETAARITELQEACSRHEADASAARAELKAYRESFY